VTCHPGLSNPTNEVQTAVRRGEGWPSLGITSILAASACLFLGFHLALALGREDVDDYESPLMLSVARQLMVGPCELYGPFGGSNPLVLIHAPLYYRAAALAAWPMTRAGLHPVDAARWAGRGLSFLGLLATMAAAYRLGRLDGLPTGRAGLWPACLLAASPVLAGLPFAVRPDMAGVALQTWGVVLVLESVAGSKNGLDRRLVWASVLFGLAACVKQHFVGAWAVSAALAASGWLRGSLGSGSRSISRIVWPGVAVAGVIYSAEWLVTAGRVWEAAFVAAANVHRVHPGDWLHVGTVVAAVTGKSAGLAALAVAGATANSRSFPRWVRAVIALLVVSIAALTVAQLVVSARWITAMLPLIALAGLAIALPGWIAPVRPSAAGGRVDAALAFYFSAETILLILLCRSSSGAWINYGIPAMVFAVILTARSLTRAVGAARSRDLAAIIFVAAAAVLASVLMDAKVEANHRRAEHANLYQVFASTRLPATALFFADRPGLNRMSGRLEWVYDDWLYPAFESRKLAEPRARWLRPMVGSLDALRAVVLQSDRPGIDGLPESLSAFGFTLAGRFGPFRVWIRADPAPGVL
jgi:hypothetical protein